MKYPHIRYYQENWYTTSEDCLDNEEGEHSPEIEEGLPCKNCGGVYPSERED